MVTLSELKRERIIIHALFVSLLVATVWVIAYGLGAPVKPTDLATGISPFWAMIIALYLPTLAGNQRKIDKAREDQAFISNGIDTMIIELEEVARLGANFKGMAQQLVNSKTNPPGNANMNRPVRPYFERMGSEISRLGPEVIKVIAKREEGLIDATANFERALAARPMQPGDLLHWSQQMEKIAKHYIDDLRAVAPQEA